MGLSKKLVQCTKDVLEVEKRVKYSEDRQLLHVKSTGQLTINLNYTGRLAIRASKCKDCFLIYLINHDNNEIMSP